VEEDMREEGNKSIVFALDTMLGVTESHAERK